MKNRVYESSPWKKVLMDLNGVVAHAQSRTYQLSARRINLPRVRMFTIMYVYTQMDSPVQSPTETSGITQQLTHLQSKLPQAIPWA